MRDALEFEWLGKPSVVVVADALTGPADAMLRISGMEHYRYAVTPFPVGNLDGSQLAARADALAGEVLALLVDRPAAGPSSSDVDEPEAPLIYDDAFGAIADYTARGWTDGLPIVPPTRALVDSLLATTPRAADDVVVRIETRDGLDADVESIAINAVMAGCRPEQFPLVLAAMDAMADPLYNLHAHTATMAGAQQLIIVNGPIRDRLELWSGNAALGPGWPANNTIGRAARLVIRNRLRSLPGEFDRAGFSHPGRFGWCLAEADEHSPWPPLAAQNGVTSADAVSVYATLWQASVINHDTEAPALLDEIALATRTACHVNWLHRDVATESSFFAARPFLFVTGREHARVLTAGGRGDLARLREDLHHRLVQPHAALRPVAIAGPEQIFVLYLHATGMQQSWFFAPFQSHNMVSRPV